MATIPGADAAAHVPDADHSPDLQRGVRVTMRRLMPLLVAMYVVSFLDRVNITFAEKGLTEDLGLTATVFGLVSVIFYLGYALLEVPSNLILHRVGARIWLARIMITWCLLSSATAFVWDSGSLITSRILLGIAEAGLFPGVIYLFTVWLPDRNRDCATSIFYFGIVIATLIGAPLSGLLLSLDGFAGLAGWQWMFIIEGLPAVLIGPWALRAMPNRPSDARSLDAEAAAALKQRIATESAAVAARAPLSLRQALLDRRVLWLSAAYVMVNVAANGALFWLGGTVGRIDGLSEPGIAYLSAAPFLLGAVGLIVFGRMTDKMADHRRPPTIGMLLGAVGIAATALLPPTIAIAALAGRRDLPHSRHESRLAHGGQVPLRELCVVRSDVPTLWFAPAAFAPYGLSPEETAALAERIVRYAK